MSSRGNKLLVGGAFITSITYLAFKIYEKREKYSSETNENYLILKRMKERIESGHLQDTPFPSYLELESTKISEFRRNNLCESIQNQLEKDWNHFIYKCSKLIFNR